MDGGDGLRAIGDIGDRPRRVAAVRFDFFYERLEPILSTRDDADRAFLPRQLLRQRPADAARRARDHGDLIRKRQSVSPSYGDRIAVPTVSKAADRTKRNQTPINTARPSRSHFQFEAEGLVHNQKLSAFSAPLRF